MSASVREKPRFEAPDDAECIQLVEIVMNQGWSVGRGYFDTRDMVFKFSFSRRVTQPGGRRNRSFYEHAEGAASTLKEAIHKAAMNALEDDDALNQ